MAAERADKVDQRDWLQAAVIRRAAELGMSAGTIADATAGKVSRQHVHAYLTKQASMGSRKLQHVLAALGLGVSPSQTCPRPENPPLG